MTDNNNNDDEESHPTSPSSRRTPNGTSDLLSCAPASSSNDNLFELEGDYSDGEDDDDDDIDDAGIQDDMIMANRTSQLMNSFRDYITEIQGDASLKSATTNSSVAVAAGNDADEGTVTFDTSPETSTTNHALEAVAVAGASEEDLMRGWSYRDDPTSSSSTTLNVNSGYGDIHDDYILSRSKYKSTSYPIYRSKKMKRCFLAVVVAGALIGTIVGVSKREKEKSLPDWEAELAEVQAEEKAKGNGSSLPQVGEPLQKPVVETASSPTTSTSKATENKAEEIIDFTLHHPDTLPYKEVGEKYNPVWYDRSSSWQGSNYQQAMVFCAMKKDAQGQMMVPCPYEAYCPEGISNMPYGGVKQEIGTWAAVSDEVNEWVQVGSENTCRLYSSLNNQDRPDWGLSGGNEALTGHIMCCHSTYVEDNAASGGDGGVSMSDATVAATTTVATTTTATATTKPYFEEEPVDFEAAAEEYVAAEAYSPVWYSRDDGWTGQSYLSATMFCSEKGKKLCPYEVYCPTGANHLPYGGVREETTWSPVIDSQNSWVQVSSPNTCELYIIMNLQAPHWGLTGEGNEEITRHVMCCEDATAQPVATSSDAGGSSSNTETQATVMTVDGTNPNAPATASSEQMAAAFADISQKLKPIAFDRSQGWSGQTYLDAITFCAKKGSKIPCPYEAHCPMGPYGPPMEG